MFFVQLENMKVFCGLVEGLILEEMPQSDNFWLENLLILASIATTNGLFCVFLVKCKIITYCGEQQYNT
jgi:hypothetical protein